jgi:hypothetical protein
MIGAQVNRIQLAMLIGNIERKDVQVLFYDSQANRSG